MTTEPGVIDLNADLGESFGAWRLGDDQALLGIVTSANIACGFHAGDPLTIRRACAGAVAHRVSIGAQVSYRDLAGFGRREMDVPPEELTAEVLYQIAAVDGIARAEGGKVGYVKPHGALYNRCARDPVQAAALAAAISAYDPRLPLLTLPCGEASRVAADAGLTVAAEAFADRAYRGDGTSCPVASRAPLSPTRHGWPHARRRWRPATWWSRSTGGRCPRRSVLSACTVTPGGGHAGASGPGRAGASRGARGAVRMMRARPAGDAALLVQVDDLAGRLKAAIVAQRIPGVLDVIPGACTVLVTTEPGRLDLRKLAERVGPRAATARSRGGRHRAGRAARGR